MTKDDALIIKGWRVDEGCTWRMVATLADEEWPDRGYTAGSPWQGQDLCEDAATVLGEDADDDAWF